MSTRRTILFHQRGGASFHLPLRHARVTVGRGSECSVCLPDPDRHLSRVHFVVQRQGDVVTVHDRSCNGVWIAGSRMTSGGSRAWRAGETIHLPGWRAELRSNDACADTPASAEATSRCSYAPSDGQPPVPTASRPGREDSLFEFDRDGLIGRSPPMLALFESIRRFARHDVPVLIRGETGTGKELVARALHTRSRRSRGAFVAVNCGGIHESTAASRLFGHSRGAFTGAVTSNTGAFREAAGGTLFLDELGELPLGLQAALLRAIETREVVPLGSSRPIPVDFRLLAATHRDLDSMVRSGHFRADLLFRLNVATLPVPPLRERGEDIELLAQHFLQTLSVGTPSPLDLFAIRALRAHPWPGNVRELRNATLRALLTADGGRVLTEHFALNPPAGPGTTNDLKVRYSAHESDRRQLVRALADCGGNRKEAARTLGIARSTLYERIRRWGVD